MNHNYLLSNYNIHIVYAVMYTTCLSVKSLRQSVMGQCGCRLGAWVTLSCRCHRYQPVGAAKWWVESGQSKYAWRCTSTVPMHIVAQHKSSLQHRVPVQVQMPY